jgi:hypothetical protein
VPKPAAAIENVWMNVFFLGLILIDPD